MAHKASETRWELQKDRMLRAAARCFNEKGYSGSSLKDVAALLDARRLHRVEQAVERAERLLELRPVDDGPAAALATQDPGPVEVADRLAHGVATHPVLVDQLVVGGETVGELPGGHTREQVLMDALPQRLGLIAFTNGHRGTITGCLTRTC